MRQGAAAIPWILAVLLIGGLSCRGVVPRPPAVSLTLLYTTNANGELERCGCSADQLGGVARRKSVIDGVRTENTLLVDAGDMLFGSFGDLVGSPEFYDAKSAAMIRAMNRMDYDAAAPGDYDFAEGAALLGRRMGEASFPFVCANLLGPDGAPAAAPYRIVTRGGLRVAVIGFLDDRVTRPAYAKALGAWRITDPGTAAERLLPELARKSDLVVALIHFPVTDAAVFLERFPGIHIAVLGHRTGEGVPERVGRTVTVAGGDLGQEVGRLTVRVLPGKGVVEAQGEMLPVSEDLPADPGVEREVERFYATVREQRFSERISFLPASKGEYAGADSCAACHPLFYQRWSATPHAYAFETLKSKGYEFDPECVVCHVVGYRDPKGFTGEGKTPHLAGVQCESCHGPAAGHLLGKPLTARVDEEVCRGCHNEIHSPAFDPETYFTRSDQCTGE